MAKVSKSASSTTHGNTVTMIQVKIVFQVFPGINGTDDQRGIAGVPYTLSLNSEGASISTTSKTGADGSASFQLPSDTSAIINIFDTEYAVSTLSSIEPILNNKGMQQRLGLLGYELGDPDGSIGKKSDRSLLNFQADSDLNADGRIDTFTRDQLVKDFGE